MSVDKNTVMLKADSKKFLLAMAEAETEPKQLAEKAGVPPSYRASNLLTHQMRVCGKCNISTAFCQRNIMKNKQERRCTMRDNGKIFETLVHLAVANGITIRFAPLHASYARLKNDRIAFNERLDTIDESV